MPRHSIALLTGALLLAAPATSQALELGISDAQATITERNEWATNINATWERIIVDLDQPGIADRIRASHTAGRQVILTVGGPGTNALRPNVRRTLAYLATLPAAERYTLGGEPDLVGDGACAYRKDWMAARRVLGHRLLWGDLSPHYPVTFTLRAAACGPLPHHLEFAVHPYQPDDPLAPTGRATRWYQGALGNLGSARRALREAGFSVSWWFTEFGYGRNAAGYRMSDDRAAWLWPRAINRAEALGARVLVIYTAQGSDESWNTRPGEQAWAAIRTGAVG